MSNSAGQLPPGWYYAHGDPPNTQRYWDGTAWIGAPRPGPGPGAGYDEDVLSIALPVPRVGARLIDWVMWLAIRLAAASLLGLVVDVGDDSWAHRLAVPLASFVLIALYEAGMTMATGATIGKMAFGLRTVDSEGFPVEPVMALRRVAPLIAIGLLEGLVMWRTWWLGVLGLLVVLASVMLGFVGLFTDAKRRTPWDRLADTVVVRK